MFRRLLPWPDPPTAHTRSRLRRDVRELSPATWSIRDLYLTRTIRHIFEAQNIDQSITRRDTIFSYRQKRFLFEYIETVGIRVRVLNVECRHLFKYFFKTKSNCSFLARNFPNSHAVANRMHKKSTTSNIFSCNTICIYQRFGVYQWYRGNINKTFIIFSSDKNK